MFAIFESLGRQYKVRVGDIIRVDRISGDEGESLEKAKVVFKQVLAVGESENLQIGQPYVSGAEVVAEVVKEGKEKKLIAYKKKRRKGYERKLGFRRQYTEAVVREIKAA